MRDLIIVGGGLAGASLAAAMARQGLRTLLVERRELPRHKVCGEFLSPEALGSLQALSLWHQVAALSPQPISRALLVGRRGATLRLALPGEGWAISRYQLDQALLQAAQAEGAEVQTGVAASHIARDGASYRVAVGGEWLRSRAVVAAWGRQTLPALRAHQPPAAGRAWVGVKRHYAWAAPWTGEVALYFIAGGYVGLVPVEGGRVNCSALVQQGAFQRAGGSPAALLEAACRQNPALATRLAGARPVAGSEVTVAGVDTGRCPIPWSDSGWPLLGDGAAMIPPLVGDGMAMALRTVELTLPLVSDYLAGRLSLDGWAEGYRRAYQAEFAQRIALAQRMQGYLNHPLFADLLLLLGRILPGTASRLVAATRGPVLTP